MTVYHASFAPTDQKVRGSNPLRRAKQKHPSIRMGVFALFCKGFESLRRFLLPEKEHTACAFWKRLTSARRFDILTALFALQTIYSTN